MKTKEEIIAFIEEELDCAYQGYSERIEEDEAEAMKYRIRANTLEDLLLEIDKIDNKTTEYNGIEKEDLSEKEKLRHQLSKMKDECDKKKWSRVKRTFFVLTGILYIVLFACGISGEISDIKECLYLIVGVPAMAALVMFVSLLVLLYIVSGAMKDEKAIVKLESELNK